MISNFKYILYAIVSWVIALNLLMLFRFFGHSEFVPNWKLELIGATTSGIVVGVIFSLIDNYVNQTKIKLKSFGFNVAIKSLVFFVSIMFAITVTVFTVEFIKGNASIQKAIAALFKAFISKETILYTFYAVIMSILFYYHRQVSKKIGARILMNLLLGRYHKPKQEKRIFMFLDLTSATTIAEKLGAYKYSLFLKDFFFDVDEAIIETKGTAIQFVGDEIIIVWDPVEGIENTNCIKLFFLVERKIQISKNKYEDKYGIVPEFKAGLHYGDVIISEVGGTKQDIAYHGDTVNTAARIRSECNVVNEKLLISAELLSILTELDNDYCIESKGVFSLKGKKNVIGLFCVNKKND